VTTLPSNSMQPAFLAAQWRFLVMLNFPIDAHVLKARVPRATEIDSWIPAVGSAEEFITEHYWGYSSQRDGSTVEYRVEHPQWRVWPATQFTAEGDFGDFYGAEFGSALALQPTSVFVADGSPVTVRQGAKLAAAER
jgi:uncharacterized protein YqjF (DUF2071 family)